jgi:Metallo-peptidase family M12
MWWKASRFSGMFTYRGSVYYLKDMGGQVHAVIETDPSKMPPDHAATSTRAQSGDVKDDPLVVGGEAAAMRPNRSNVRDKRDAGTRPTPQAQGTSEISQVKIQPLTPEKRRELTAKQVTIDVMFLYTPRMAPYYIDVNTDLLSLAIEEANQSFRNSGLPNIKLALVHSQAIDYDERKGEHFDHLYAMVDGIGSFSVVRRLRNEKRADVVVLLVDDPSGCGLSTRVGADADEAFAVVHHSCAALSYTVAHEIAHLIGARHDLALDKNAAPFPYGHGYVNGTKWRDVMQGNRI